MVQEIWGKIPRINLRPRPQYLRCLQIVTRHNTVLMVSQHLMSFLLFPTLVSSYHKRDMSALSPGGGRCHSLRLKLL